MSHLSSFEFNCSHNNIEQSLWHSGEVTIEILEYYLTFNHILKRIYIINDADHPLVYRQTLPLSVKRNKPNIQKYPPPLPGM